MITRHMRGQKIQSEETNESSKEDSTKMEVLALSDWEFKTTMMNIQQAQKEKVNHKRTYG